MVNWKQFHLMLGNIKQLQFKDQSVSEFFLHQQLTMIQTIEHIISLPQICVVIISLSNLEIRKFEERNIFNYKIASSACLRIIY